ncbi:MAG: hypothetical protein CMG44_04195 [Candidatus Marinimicrobia bacterium]|nr:hypothetical protein [Candidatus Neomarinimicrobiota bacterium]|tara:strand:- start:386 stop:868 length:483 start_codon:yes stop_codon:yes gene_type:complete
MKNIITILIITLFFYSCDTFKSVDEYFSEAEQMRSERKPKEALRLLNKIIKKFSKDNKASEAQYLIAEIYYRDLQDFSKSIDEYDKFAEKHPNSDKVPFSIFMQGYIYSNELKEYDSAKALYENFINLYPNHEMVKDVEFEIKYMGFELNQIPELKHLTE